MNVENSIWSPITQVASDLILDDLHLRIRPHVIEYRESSIKHQISIAISRKQL